MNPKIAFIGAVELSHHALSELIEQGTPPDLVCTLNLEYARRHSDFVDIGELAEQHNIPVLRVNNINEPQAMARLRDLAPDYLFVIGWSQILKPDLLNLPSISCVGFHFAKLPQNRGRAAIPWTILNQETEAGVTLMHLDDGVDTGDIITQRAFPVELDETARSLYNKVCDGLRDMIREVAQLFKDGTPLPANSQDNSKATYLAKRVASDGWIEWERPASEIERLIRAVGDPYPGAFTIYKNKKLTIWKACLRPTYNYIGTVGQVLANHDGVVTVQCGEGWLDLITVEDEASNGQIPATDYFSRVHDRLGIHPFKLWQMVTQLQQQIDGK